MTRKNRKLLQLKGIQRNFPAGLNDGGCEEFINLRYRHGAIQPVGSKQQLYPLPAYTNITVHRQDEFENWIGLDGNDVVHYNPENLAVTQTLVTVTGTINQIRVLKNYLIIITSERTYLFLYNNSNSTYDEIDLSTIRDVFDVSFTQINEVELSTDTATDAAGLYGKFLELINEQSNDSKFYGAVTYRLALRLFDGSYIFHTVPRFYQFAEHTTFIAQISSGTYRFNDMHFAGIEAAATFDTSGKTTPLTSLEPISRIVSSIELFFSPVRYLYDITEDTITDDNLNDWLPFVNPLGQSMGVLVEVQEPFKELPDQPAWYRVGEIMIEDLTQDSVTQGLYEGSFNLDMEGYYQNFATRRTLPVDGFSHHLNSGKASIIYNDRLTIGNTTQTLADPLIKEEIPIRQPNVFEPEENDHIQYEKNPTPVNIRVIITLNTQIGDKTIILREMPIAFFQNPSQNNRRAIFLNGIIGYFDERAKNIKVLLENSSNYYLVYEHNLIGSVYSNYSFVANETFDPGNTADPNRQETYDSNFRSIQVTYRVDQLTTPYTTPTEDKNVVDNNNTVHSNVNNPFVFEPANNQNVSEGTILDFGANVDPISEGQFGQYPLYVFTSVGIWALQISTGTTYITALAPLNREVLLAEGAKTDITFGTVFATNEGLKLLAGRELIEISETAEGIREVGLIDNEQLQYFLNLEETVDLDDVVDKINFNTYLNGANIGYNKNQDNNEIVVANPNYQYAYIFDIKHKFWYKLTGNYTELINFYPSLYAKKSAAGSGNNLVINGGFQGEWSPPSAPAGWNQTGLVMLRDVESNGNIRAQFPGQGYNINAVLFPNTNNNPDNNLTGIDVIQGQRYRVTWDYFFESSSTVDLYVTIRVRDAALNNWYYDGSSSWSTTTTSFLYKNQAGEGFGTINVDLPAFPATGFLRIGFNNSQPGSSSYYIDDVQVYDLSSLPGNIVNLSSEIESDVATFFMTKPVSFDDHEQFKKLRRSFLRGFLNLPAGEHAAMYIFGSDDLKEWTFVTGNDRNTGSFNNIWVTHSNDSKRYYVYVFASEISVNPNLIDSYIKHIELELTTKWTNKIR